MHFRGWHLEDCEKRPLAVERQHLVEAVLHLVPGKLASTGKTSVHQSSAPGARAGKEDHFDLQKFVPLLGSPSGQKAPFFLGGKQANRA